MKAVKKDLSDFPPSLVDKTRKDALEKCISAQEYTGKKKYDAPGVREKLCEVYNYKCAYCEKNITDEDKHIEHYRPKNRYYWLAFSWDNLLLACSRCNKNKGENFEIKVKEAVYDDFCDFNLENLQTAGGRADKIEIPLLVNPEKEEQSFFDENLVFNAKGEILSENERLYYTIKLCDLNRKGLEQKRLSVINELKKNINCIKFLKGKNLPEYAKAVAEQRKYLREKIKAETEFSALHKHIEQNFEMVLK